MEQLQIEESMIREVSNLIWKRKYQEALNKITEYLPEMKIETARMENKRLTVFIELGKYEEALKEINRLVIKYPDYASRYEGQRIKALIELERYDEVILLVPKLISKYPQSADVYENQNIVALKKMDNLDSILNEVEILINKYPNNASVYESQKISILTMQGKYDEALANINRAICLYPQSEAVYQSQSVNVLIASGKLEDAKAKAIEYAKQYPQEKSRFQIQLLDAMLNNGEYNEVCRLAQKFALNDPVNERTYNMYKYRGINSNVVMINPYCKPSISKCSKIDIEKLANEEGIKRLREILSLEEKQFDSYVKGLGDKEKIFLQVARYKYQRNDVLAEGILAMYAKRENSDRSIVKPLNMKIKQKKSIFDIASWAELANKLKIQMKNNIDVGDETDSQVR